MCIRDRSPTHPAGEGPRGEAEARGSGHNAQSGPVAAAGEGQDARSPPHRLLTDVTCLTLSVMTETTHPDTAADDAGRADLAGLTDLEKEAGLNAEDLGRLVGLVEHDPKTCLLYTSRCV